MAEKSIDPVEPVMVHTDGACHPNDGTGTGGWAFVVNWGQSRATRHGFKEPSTNNECELLGILRSLQYVRRTRHPLVIHTDSRYCRDCLTKWVPEWKKHGWVTSTGKPVANRALLEEIDALLAFHRRRRKVSIEWVKGHASDQNNGLADLAAVTARKQRVTSWKEADERTKIPCVTKPDTAVSTHDETAP